MALAACQAIERHRRQSIVFTLWSEVDRDRHRNIDQLHCREGEPKDKHKAQVTQGVSVLFGLLLKLSLLPISLASLTVSSANTVSSTHCDSNRLFLPIYLPLPHHVSWGSKQMESSGRRVRELGIWPNDLHSLVPAFEEFKRKDTWTKETPM